MYLALAAGWHGSSIIVGSSTLVAMGRRGKGGEQKEHDQISMPLYNVHGWKDTVEEEYPQASTRVQA
jgi:hypothetical protein